MSYDKIIDTVERFYTSFAYEIIAFLVLSAVYLLIISAARRRKVKKLKTALERADMLLFQIQPAKGLEKNLAYMLEMVGDIIHASTYAFYVFDPKNNNYILKAVRHQSVDFGKVRPSYSGLVSHKKESYIPPVSLGKDSMSKHCEIVQDGEVPLLVLPVGNHGMVRMGPTDSAKRVTKLTLEDLSNRMDMLLQTLIDTEALKNQVEIASNSAKALKNISEIATEHQTTMELMLKASCKSMEADGGIVLERKEDGYQISSSEGFTADEIVGLKSDSRFIAFIIEWMESRSHHILTQNDPHFHRIPEILSSKEVQLLAAVSVGQDNAGALSYIMYWFRSKRKEQDLLSHGLSALQTIGQEMSIVFHSQHGVAQLSYSYTNLMKNLARMMDNLNPYTIGYSELMSRYSIIIARELGLPEHEIRDIALAAHLSNIGTLGLSTDLYQKEGKYTEMEFELMKLHSEVGAAIVSVTTGNKVAANYIMYHHERMDGNGYPSGLRGEEIPMGARIIAVVQTFLAKINGRKSRDPLRFDQALQTLKAASGTQLDAKVVDTLIQWFRRKRSNPDFSHRSLGSCWEMCCTPSSVCEHCPVYRRTDVNCWQVEGNNCQAHGKSCDTCFVHTEFMTRTSSIK